MSMNVDVSAAPRGLIRQGDLLLVPIAELPERVELVRRGRLVLAEGEATGHAHVVDDERASLHGHRWSDVRYLQRGRATSRCRSSTRSTTAARLAGGVRGAAAARVRAARRSRRVSD